MTTIADLHTEREEQERIYHGKKLARLLNGSLHDWLLAERLAANAYDEGYRAERECDMQYLRRDEIHSDFFSFAAKCSNCRLEIDMTNKTEIEVRFCYECGAKIQRWLPKREYDGKVK